MLEEEKKSNSAVAIPLVVLILAGIYVFADGWFFNVIEPHTAVAVYEPRGIRALYNGEDKPKRMWKWPRIPGTLIGVKEEPVKDEVKVAEDSFAFYTSYELTGKEEDREYVQAYKVRVKMKVKDWQKFFREINLDEINKQRRKAGPFTPLIKDRFELIASQVKEVLRGGPVQDNFGNPLRDEKGYPVMNLNGWVNFISSELLGRRNFLIALFDHHDFKTPESVKKYLKEEAPWYWFAGPDLFELMAQRFKDIQEAVKSPYSENLSEKASLKRFVFGEERFELYRQAYRAYQYENFLMATKQALEEINLRLSQTQDEKARQLLLWQKEKLDFEKKRWEKVKEEELIPFFKFYSSSESRLACDIRKVTPQENELLWEVAIKEVFEGEDLSKLSLFILHKTKSKDTLEKI
ncbi:hypothetical protein H5U35_05400, partial [Candidatus Aerophobetes bacterium]|nr:hypothetical protein [Candidatus Aerophobetes bacterium]